MGRARAKGYAIMSVWMACPSKRPPAEAEPIFAKWRERGYKIALWRDGSDVSILPADLSTYGSDYPGYAVAVNRLVSQILRYPDAEWIVAAADDIEPDPNHTAQEIAEQCCNHFDDLVKVLTGTRSLFSTWGVMQPTGDRWGDAQGPYIDRVAGSAWLGREFCKRINQGRGPIWPEYTHQFEDQELRAVAVKRGIYWERPDLIHFHRHWGRPREGERMAPSDRMPEFLKEANSPEHWKKFKKLYYDREAAGFPGHEPL